MISSNESHNAHYQQGEETDSHKPSHGESVSTPDGQRSPIVIPRGPSGSGPGAQHCLLCQTETVGACLLCHRPLCEQCGRSEDDFLRCPSHHEHEVEALRSVLRQAALGVLNTRQYLTDLVALRTRVLSSVNAALLRSYVEHTGGVPSPAQRQQMRRVAVGLWNSLATVTDPEDEASLPGKDEGEPRDDERDVSQGRRDGAW